MSEERILRLENAMATLAEISAQHNERLAATESTAQTLRELATDQKQLTANMQGRVRRLEESYVTVVELLQSHNDGMTELRAAQANSEQKIAELTDAQIRAEEGVGALRAGQADAETRIAALADAQIRAEAAQERRNERLQSALTQLAESQAHADRRLDALIDIVRGGRDGQSES